MERASSISNDVFLPETVMARSSSAVLEEIEENLRQRKKSSTTPFDLGILIALLDHATTTLVRNESFLRRFLSEVYHTCSHPLVCSLSFVQSLRSPNCCWVCPSGSKFRNCSPLNSQTRYSMWSHPAKASNLQCGKDAVWYLLSPVCEESGRSETRQTSRHVWPMPSSS